MALQFGTFSNFDGSMAAAVGVGVGPFRGMQMPMTMPMSMPMTMTMPLPLPLPPVSSARRKRRGDDGLPPVSRGRNDSTDDVYDSDSAASSDSDADYDDYSEDGDTRGARPPVRTGPFGARLGSPVSSFGAPTSAQLGASGCGSVTDSQNGDSSTVRGANGRARLKEQKTCGVCGDKALGYNFDAVSCESCKAFFRRNALKGVEYFKCPYEEKCRMDIANRRFCKRCRLKRCFDIGMRKEYILTEDEKVKKRQKIEENRMYRELEKQGLLPPKSEVGTVQQPFIMPKSLDPEEQAAIDEVVTAFDSSLETSMKGTVRDPAITGAQHAEASVASPASSVSSVSSPGSVQVPTPGCSLPPSSLADLVNICEISIRRVIAMAKRIACFKRLPQNDQMNLLKSGSIELLILRGVIGFDREKGVYLDPTDKQDVAIPAQSVYEIEQISLMRRFSESHYRFVRSMTTKLNADQTTLLLLLVITMLAPDRCALLERAYVEQEQLRYTMLLKRYLESKYPLPASRSLFPKLLAKLVELRELNDELSAQLLHVNIAGCQPLMTEMLSLKL